MRRLTTLVLAILVDARAATLLAEDADASRIQKTWRMTKVTKNGGPVEGDHKLPPITVTFTDEKWTATVGETDATTEVRGSYTLDATQTPKLLNLQLVSDGQPADLYLIYRFAGDALEMRLREGGGGKQRPVDFESPADDCTTITLAEVK